MLIYITWILESVCDVMDFSQIYDPRYKIETYTLFSSGSLQFFLAVNSSWTCGWRTLSPATPSEPVILNLQNSDCNPDM